MMEAVEAFDAQSSKIMLRGARIVEALVEGRDIMRMTNESIATQLWLSPCCMGLQLFLYAGVAM